MEELGTWGLRRRERRRPLVLTLYVARPLADESCPRHDGSLGRVPVF